MILIYFRCNWRQCCLYSTKRKAKINPYFDSLFLPTTSLPRTIPINKQMESDLNVQKNSKFSSLYKWQENLKDRPIFSMLITPTIANDKPQTEQVINKIFADIINRYKLLRGSRIHYQTGWECHSFPVEPTKIPTTDEEKNAFRLSVQTEIDTVVKRHKMAFKHWGIMADWDNSYLTSNNDCMETQIRMFWKMYEKNLIFRDLKPVYWSPALRTALAESDLEYNYNHKSRSIYLRIPLCKFPSLPSASLGSDKQIFALIMTHSLWMLPSCEMICFSEMLSYSIVQCENTKDLYILKSSIRKKLEQQFSTKYIVISSFEGSALKNATYIHPFRKIEQPFHHAEYVNDEKGTGLMLGNPSHNFDDYQIAKETGLPMTDLINEQGLFMKEAGSLLEDKHIFGKGADAIIAALGNDILSQQESVGQCLYERNKKTPVIVRRSHQWFFDVGMLKDKVLNCLQETEIIPNHLLKSVELQLKKNSPHWCISRQNVIGIPIPVFYNKTSGKPIVTRKLIDCLCKLFQQHGGSIWWMPSDQQILANILNEENLTSENEFVKGNDVLDPQFSGGIYWNLFLKDTGNIADVCVEGLNQIQGLFQSSLLTSIALQSKPPYRKLLLHGFSAKERKGKMPKSVKNIIDQWTILNDPKSDKSKIIGSDALRWWTATCALQTEESDIEDEIVTLDGRSADVRKIRMMLWFLLGNISEFEEKSLVDYSKMTFINKYVLHQLSEFQSKLLKDYSEFAFEGVANTILNFINDEIPNVYLQAIKDRLFSGERNGETRRSSQSCCYYLLNHLTYAIAPILPHLAEEIYYHNPMHKSDSLFKTTWTECPEYWQNAELKSMMDIIIQVKKLIDKIAGSSARRSSEITIQGSDQLLKRLEPLHTDIRESYSDLCDILEVANVKLSYVPLQESSDNFEGMIKIPEGSFKVQLQASPCNYSKCQRCSRHVADNNDICIQCSQTLSNKSKH